MAQPPAGAGAEAGEASLKLPDLSSVTFLGMNGHSLLMIGLLFCVFGLLFGLVIYMQLKNLPVHRAMREISELIYETCKTYLVTQGKFILVLWAFIAVIIAMYFGWLAPVPGKPVGVTLAHHSGLQPGRHCRQLRRGVVRHPRQHLCQLPHRLCRLARQAVSRSMTSRCGPA